MTQLTTLSARGRFATSKQSMASAWIPPLQTVCCRDAEQPSFSEIRQRPQLVIVGDGRIGRAFLQMAGPRTRLVARGQIVASEQDGEDSYPIIVTTHCSHLEAVLKQTCEKKWKDLVFVQNGMLQQWLYQHGLQNNTQIVLFMSAKPENPLKPKGHMTIKDGGQDSLAWGRWASVICETMQAGGLQCSSVSYGIFFEVMIEKLLWSSIFWLLSAALGELSVGVISENYIADVEELTCELLPIARLPFHSSLKDENIFRGIPGQVNNAAGFQIRMDSKDKFCLCTNSEMVRRLCAYSMAIPDAVPSVVMAISEFDWRNGWFLSQKLTPCHVQWLKRAGVDSKLWCTS